MSDCCIEGWTRNQEEEARQMVDRESYPSEWIDDSIGYSRPHGNELSGRIFLRTKQKARARKNIPNAVIQETAEAKAFLLSHPAIRDIVRESIPFIESVFGAGTVCSSRMYIDPEEDYSDLTVYISITGDWLEALDNLQKFRDLWWRDASRRAGGKLCFNLEQA